MSRIQWKVSAAMVLLLLGAVLAAAWQLQSEQSAAVLPSVAPASSNSASTMVSAQTQNAAVVSAAPVIPPVPPESARVHPEDALVSEPYDEKPSSKVIEAVREIKKTTPDEGTVTINPDGSEKLSLGNRYISVPVATVGKDGKVHVDYHGEKYGQKQEAKTTPLTKENQP
jgi:hypothetical protein